jgi:hypothetical protein
MNVKKHPLGLPTKFFLEKNNESGVRCGMHGHLHPTNTSMKINVPSLLTKILIKNDMGGRYVKGKSTHSFLTYIFSKLK